MSIDTYLGQQQPPMQIGGKPVDLHMAGPSERERGPSGPVAACSVFRSELLRSALEPPRTPQTQNDPFRPSGYSAGQSEYIIGRSGHMAEQSSHAAGWSAYLTGRSDLEYVEPYEKDYYPYLHPSQLNFSSHPTVPQHVGVSIFWPLLEGRKEMTSHMSRIGQALIHHKTQASGGGKQHTNIQTTTPMLDQRAGGLPPAAIDIVREEIAGPL